MVNFTNSILKKLVNVYQHKNKYKNTCDCGLGDFLRGSFFLLQIAMTYGLRFDIDYNNHPLCKFLYKEKNTIDEQIDYPNVYYYHPDNGEKTTQRFYDNFIKYLNYNNVETLYLLNNNFPIKNITEFQSKFIKSKFLPNEELTNAITKEMNKLNIQPNNFSVIHIRTGDRFIVNGENLDNELITKVTEILSKINLNEPIVLLSDCNKLKSYLKHKYPQLIININEITHIARENNQSNNSIKNTLTDFFIMSKSNKIYAMSPYGHRTGFSEYCSKIFMIPYEFYNLNIRT